MLRIRGVVEVVEAWDRRAIAAAQRAPRWQPADRLLHALSGLARGSGWVAIAAVLAARRTPGAGRALAGTSAALAGSVLLELALKLRMHRRRPDRDHGEHEPGPRDMERHAFPSGHAVGAFSCATTIARVYPRTGPWALGTAAVLSAARVYLLRHNPSDVVGGALLGLALGLGADELAARAALPALREWMRSRRVMTASAASTRGYPPRQPRPLSPRSRRPVGGPARRAHPAVPARPPPAARRAACG